jgi:uncharacterized protein
MARSGWRRWNNILHRDIGYLAVGMTLIYGISGIAVNHTADWNPNYRVDRRAVEIEPILTDVREEMVQQAMARLDIVEAPQNSFRPDRETLQLFYERTTYSIDLPTGKVIVEDVRPRRVLFEFNQLHLNSPKNAWTYIADLYAASLIFVAVTGMFVLKGRLGITGRGAWLTGIGIAIPLLYWVYYLLFA